MQHQIEQRKGFTPQTTNRDIIYENGPKISYDFYFKIFGYNLNQKKKFFVKC